MKKIFFCGCLIAYSILATSQTNAISLQQAVETGIKNNLDVKQSDLRMQTASVNWKQSKANLFPSLEGFANHGINQGRSIDPFTNAFVNQSVNYAGYGLNTSVIIFNGLAIQNNIRQNALTYEATRLELQQEKDNLTLNIILSYLQALNNQDLLTQSRNQAEVSRKQVERLDILSREGAIAPAQLYDLKGQLANDELAIVNNQNAVNAAKLTLSQLMNVPYNKSIQLEKLNVDEFSTNYDVTPEAIYKQALEQLALVKAAQLRTESAVKGIRAAKGDLYPTLSVNGNVTTNYSSAANQDIFLNTTDVTTTQYVTVNGIKTPVISPRDNFSSQKIKYNDQLDNNLFTSLNLGLRIPLFNALQARSRVKLAQINQKNFEYIEQTTKTQLSQAIEQAYFNMTAAQDRYKVLTDQVNAFKESFRSAEIRFNEGAITSVDYIIAKNNLDRANLNLISARYDYVLRTKILDYYQSKPLW
ncbi:MAG: TolC family protein [Chitinophagaceae bacterium]|nr:TolC family protein [Chitinophagaceae bacterium]